MRHSTAGHMVSSGTLEEGGSRGRHADSPSAMISCGRSARLPVPADLGLSVCLSVRLPACPPSPTPGPVPAERPGSLCAGSAPRQRRSAALSAARPCDRGPARPILVPARVLRPRPSAVLPAGLAPARPVPSRRPPAPSTHARPWFPLTFSSALKHVLTPRVRSGDTPAPSPLALRRTARRLSPARICFESGIPGSCPRGS
ncbi:vegetative cell wall protein gp1-like [Mustela putorius furo]|uniref:Vegetative cell wall protein gp1-like n=1 Tax=Mustela putorius furo TaxID=9669 RepID=A0A8U0S442_MUSPF|nr:vegetative cell wall protein gp1-like [Mustela putorius furo]